MEKIIRIIGGIAAIGGIIAFLLLKNSNLGFSFILIMLIAQAICEVYDYKETKKKTHLIIPVLTVIACFVFVCTQILR